MSSLNLVSEIHWVCLTFSANGRSKLEKLIFFNWQYPHVMLTSRLRPSNSMTTLKKACYFFIRLDFSICYLIKIPSRYEWSRGLVGEADNISIYTGELEISLGIHLRIFTFLPLTLSLFLSLCLSFSFPPSTSLNLSFSLSFSTSIFLSIRLPCYKRKHQAYRWNVVLS